jgi:thymidine kinase
MAKLYFRYGCMGSSKTANALMTKFNYEEKGKKVLLLKPSIDTRNGKTIIKSRIGLQAEAICFDKNTSIIDDILVKTLSLIDCIVVDECQFCTKEQIDDFRRIVDVLNIPVFCYGLRTDFQTKLFEGSKRLFEIADSISEIKSICSCGKKAIVNARYKDKEIIYDGEQVELGGNDKYMALCCECWNKGIIR